MRIFLRSIVSIVFVAVSSSPAWGHGAGYPLEQTVGSYLVDIGYDLPFQVGQETLLDFALFDANGEPTSFDVTRVEVSVFSGSMLMWEATMTKPEFGKVFAILTPENAGNWILEASFIGETTSVEAAFPIAVAPSSHASSADIIPIAFVIFAALAGGLYALFRRMSV